MCDVESQAFGVLGLWKPPTVQQAVDWVLLFTYVNSIADAVQGDTRALNLPYTRTCSRRMSVDAATWSSRLFIFFSLWLRVTAARV